MHTIAEIQKRLNQISKKNMSFISDVFSSGRKSLLRLNLYIKFMSLSSMLAKGHGDVHQELVSNPIIPQQARTVYSNYQFPFSWPQRWC